MSDKATRRKLYYLHSSLILCRAGGATGETGLPSPLHLTEREGTLFVLASTILEGEENIIYRIIF